MNMSTDSLDDDNVHSIAASFRNGLDAQGNFLDAKPDDLFSSTLENDAPVVVERINTHNELGVSTRLKDLALIVG